MSDDPAKAPPPKAKPVICAKCFDTGVVSGGGFNCAGVWVEHPTRCKCGWGKRGDPFRDDRVWREG